MQYDVVKVMGIHIPIPKVNDACNLRMPAIGDVATIVEIYSMPLSYELECCDEDGIPQWMMPFRPEDIELELVFQARSE